MASSKEIPAEIASALNEEQKVMYKTMLIELDRVPVTIIFYSKNEGALLYDSHDWSGSVISQYPNFIPSYTLQSPAYVTFEHQGKDGVSKAGVAYYASRQFWLLAWHDSANKVYVKVGPRGPIHWDVIEKELDASFNSSVSVKPGTIIVNAMASIRNGKISASFYD